MLKRFDCFDATSVRIEYDASMSLGSVSQCEYAKVIDSVMFCMNYTRLDIAYVVSRLSNIHIILIRTIRQLFVIY